MRSSSSLTITARAALGGILLLTAACLRRDGADTAVGTLEMVEVEVGPLQPARAVRLLVQEGDVVRTGDTVAVFATPTLAAAEAQAEARLDAARQMHTELRRGPRPGEIAKANDELQAAEAEAVRTSADLDRITPLTVRGIVSRQQLEAAQAAARAAIGRRDAAREALRLLKEGARAERTAAAAADVRGAQAAASSIRASAADLVLRAPVDGIVTSRNAEPGEVLGAGQSAVTIGQPSRPWARIYVSQFVVQRLRVGDTLVARLDRDTTAFRGRVTSIASKAEFTPRVALTEQERADLLFAIRLEFADTTGRLRAGLPITVQLPRP